MKHNSSGVSLVEIMLVISIAGILTSFGTISFSPLWNKQQLNNATNDLKGRIQVLRMEAILKSKSFRMSVNEPQLIVESKEVGTWSFDRKIALNPDVTISYSGYLYFHNRGFMSPKTIKIKRGEYCKSIVVNINGRIRESEVY